MNIFENHPELQSEEDRLQFLKDTCHRLENDAEYEVELPESRLIAFKNTLFTLEDEMDEKMEQFKLIKETHIAEIKAIKEERTNIKRAVRTGMERIIGPLFYIQNYETDMMQTVDANGNVIGSRRLAPNERQFRIMDLNKQQSNE